MIVRLAAIPFSFHIIKLFWLMIPLICIFAMPIASALAVGVTVGELFARDELLLVRYFSGARKKLELSVWIFAFALLVCYIPLIFEFAPSGYWKGKRFLVRAAQIQIEHLSPQKFHSIASYCTIFFKKKFISKEGTTQFQDILLMVHQKNKKQYLVTAQKGILESGVLKLSFGTIYNNNNANNQAIVGFKDLEIAFEKMFFDTENTLKKPSKFLTYNELIATYPTDDRAWQEFHKRIGHLIWQLFLPFMVLWTMMLFAKIKSNLLLSVVVSGGLFLCSYLSLNMAYFFLNRFWVTIFVFYSIPVVSISMLYLLYRKRWQQ